MTKSIFVEIMLLSSSIMLLVMPSSMAFTTYPSLMPRVHSSTVVLLATDQGYGDNDVSQPPKTYDIHALQPRRDVMDTDAAMREFFEGAALEWIPLFQQLTRTDVPTTSDSTNSLLGNKNGDVPFEFSAQSSPWKELPGIPTLESHRSVLANFLDHVQASLVAIPVDESTKEDENDLHFLEEGRRMLVCGRFHVVEYTSPTNRLDNFEAVFGTCWNEVYQLYTSGEKNTGSVILVPDCQNLEDLRRFVDVNLQRPLQWMGLDTQFEVASLQRGSPAIRVIYRLSDMPEMNLPDQDQNDD